MLFLLFSRRQFRLAVEKYELEYDASVLEIADYTVLVTGLPKDISPSEADTALLECVPAELATAKHCRETWLHGFAVALHCRPSRSWEYRMQHAVGVHCEAMYCLCPALWRLQSSV